MRAPVSVLRIVRRLSSSMQPSFALNWFQWACICLLTALHWHSSFWMMQCRISLRTLSLFVIAAINVELNTYLIALPSIVSDVALSSLLGLRWVVKENGLYPRFFGVVFRVESCSACISKEFCFWVSNWLVFVLIGRWDFAIACCLTFCSIMSFFSRGFFKFGLSCLLWL